MKVRDSITSKDEKLANKQLKNQWNDIDWKEVKILVNRTDKKYLNRLQKQRVTGGHLASENREAHMMPLHKPLSVYAEKTPLNRYLKEI